MKINIKPGDIVRLKNSTVRYRVPEGREDNRSARVKTVFGVGGMLLERDLNGMKWWNVEDVQVVRNGSSR